MKSYLIITITQKMCYAKIKRKGEKTMKKLNLFQKFDFVAWQKGKAFMVQGIRRNEKKGCVSLDVIIVEDNTDYGDDSVSNLFENSRYTVSKMYKRTMSRNIILGI